MRKLHFFLIYLTLMLSASACKASDDSLQLKIERAGRLIASAYALGNPDEKLFGLHPDYFPTRPGDIINKNTTIEITTEHSISEEKPHHTSLKGFDQFSKWLNDVRNNFRFRDNLEVRTMGTCIDGCCNFPLDGGISHNTLYMTQACFIIENSTPYLKSITLLDGD